MEPSAILRASSFVKPINLSSNHSLFYADPPGMVSARFLKTTSNSLQILWTLPKDTGGGNLTEIIIKRMDASGNFATSRYSPGKTNTTYTNLKPFSKYSFHLTAKNQLLESVVSKLDGKTAEAGITIFHSRIFGKKLSIRARTSFLEIYHQNIFTS